EGLVLVVGLDDIVAIGPDAAEVVQMQAMRIPITGDIQPVVGAMLAVSRTGQQPVHYFFVGVRRPVGGERFNFARRGRQASEVVRDASDQGWSVGRFRG